MRKQLTSAIILILITAMSVQPVLAQETGFSVFADSFFNLSAVIASNRLEAANTEHKVSFTLPTNSDPIHVQDYIRIYYAHFEDLTVPTHLFGDYAGIPVYSVDGQYVQITGIRLEPGGFLSIEGLTATNPADENDFQIQVMVTQGDNFSVLKNVGTTIATVNRGSVTVTASIERALASLVISGYTSPFSFLIFSQDDTVIGTDVSNATGRFIKQFSGLQPTTHSLTFYSVDQFGFNSSPVPITLYTPAYQQTTISNQLLSPTISINSHTLLQGDVLTASGSAVPNGQITIFTDSPLRSYVTTAGSDGVWNYTVSNTNEYVLGDYRIYTLVQMPGGLQSLTSPSLLFTITTDIITGTPCGDISQADLNCDGQVDLQDFSILMYYWGSSNAAADINGDTIVNLADFSIMMYYWG